MAVENKMRTSSRLAYLLPVVVTLCSGCLAVKAKDSLLAACVTAINESAAADRQLSQDLIEHNGAEKTALDAAFLQDLQRLSEKDAGKVQYQDVVQAKAIYDQRLGAILEAKEHIREFFDRKANTLHAALDLLAKARDLDAAEQQALQKMDTVLGQLKELLKGGTALAPPDAAAPIQAPKE